MENKISFQINFNWLYLAGFFLILSLPLLVLPPWFTPIGWGKAIVFRIIISVLIFLFISQVLFKKISFEYIKNKIKSISFPFRLLSALFFIYLLATIFSLDPRYSLWGDPFRAGGFITFSFYIFFAIIIFLIISQKDWQLILDFSIIIGVLVSIVAIFQQFGIFSKFFIPFTIRPGSTLGNPIFLAIYLLLLIFLTLTFGLLSKNRIKKFFYFFSLLLFFSVSIILTQTRAALAGLIIGSLWFFFGYPKKMRSLKISAAIILVLVILGMYAAKTYLDSHLYVYKKMPPIVSSTVDRVLSTFEGTKIMESRVSAWKVSFNALKERPILGYGPENFHIGFDKYYDPLLPRIGTSFTGEGAEWFDRAHNLIFDISVTAGIPALIIYLSFFGALLWQLQSIKRKRPETALICHGLQATFIGYLIANLFSFDTFDTYLLSFLLIGYSFYLISNSNLDLQTEFKPTSNKKGVIFPYKYSKIIIFALFIFLIWFIWSFNLKPLKATTNLSLAEDFLEKRKCEKVLKITDEYITSPPHTIIDNYLSMNYVRIMHDCTEQSSKPAAELAKEAIQLLKKNVELSPHDERYWLLLAEYTNILIEEQIKLTDNTFQNTPEMAKLRDGANDYFEKASLLSPKRQEVYKEWLKTGLISGDYKKAEENAQKCIDLNPAYGECYWLMGLTQGYSGNAEKFNYFVALAQEKGYYTEATDALQQLSNMYIRTKNYSALTEVFSRLIEITEDAQKKAQLHSSLAAVYKELGQIENAKKEALKILELLPFFPADLQTQVKADIEAFLKSLEQ